MSTDEMQFDVQPHWKRNAWVDARDYQEQYERSMRDPQRFWGHQARWLDWFKFPTRIKDVSFSTEDLHIRWFEDGTLNACVNCVDRHLHDPEVTAILWEGDSPSQSRAISYGELHTEVSRFANALRSRGVCKGDRVAIYLPMIPEAAVAMLACARIGAVHSVVFAGFSAQSLASRVQDCAARLVVTSDEAIRGGRNLPMKAQVDEALRTCPTVADCIVVRRTGGAVQWVEGRDHWYQDEIRAASPWCEPEVMAAEDPLFVLYTSGSTGKPKGVLHTTGGYLLAVALTHKLVLDCHANDIYWCTADIGWVTGHSYVVYGPLANGATTVMFEGVPTYPDSGRLWQIVDKHRVSILYTAPTALRSLMRQGNEYVDRSSRESLRVLGTVGEPINPAAWVWYYNVVGEQRCPVVDTWWQTETGAIAIAPFPGAVAPKPGSATLPFFGIEPVIVDDEGNILEGECEGRLFLREGGPAMLRSLYGDDKRFRETYFSAVEGLYFTGDGARRDADGYYWITGRVDDVINVSGHRLGTAELEAALTAHPKVVEAGVVGYADAVKGQGIYAYVTLHAGVVASEELRDELRRWVRTEIGPIATIDAFQWTAALPKTRSGKIMRRILRKIAGDPLSEVGDVSTLADPAVIKSLVEGRAVPCLESA